MKLFQKFNTPNVFNFLCLMLVTLSACENYIPEADTDNLEYYYEESCGLTKVPGDSIKRFATKVCNYAARYLEVESDPLYEEIQLNIHDAVKKVGISFSITINTEWAGDTVIHF